ncbi:MAG: flagellar biosynthetic protein FliO [Clostridiales bacterium]|jgi:flagellar biosynthetic protein FliO|nr:flagellar biosynthetic protein FliO [Clostridiales bacterium]
MLFANFETNGYYEAVDEAVREGFYLGIDAARPATGSSADLAMQFLGVAFALVFMLFLAFFVVRLLGRARGTRGNRNLKIVEAIAVGPQNTIQLVQAADKFFLIGVSRQGIATIGEIPADSVFIDERAVPAIPFEKYLARFSKKKEEDSQQRSDE